MINYYNKGNLEFKLKAPEIKEVSNPEEKSVFSQTPKLTQFIFPSIPSAHSCSPEVWPLPENRPVLADGGRAGSAPRKNHCHERITEKKLQQTISALQHTVY